MNIKPVFKYQDPIDKSIFKQSTCLLTISVGQEVHEGNKFAATIELVNNAFGGCVLLIDDTLQRHSMALDQKEDAAFFYEQSLFEGDMWLYRNKKYYQELTILKDIIRWDRWLNHQNYRNQRDDIQRLMSTNLDYQASFDNTIDMFLQRYYPRLLEKREFDRERARSLCMDYLLEECTALCLWTELRCPMEVYPSKRNVAMDATHKHFVIPTFPDLLQPVAIKFKNRKQLKPQVFRSIITEEI